MKKAMALGAAGAALLAVIFGVFIAIFDYREPPETDSSSWHAYLTAEEMNHPLATYWFKRAAVDPVVLNALNSGPIQQGEVLRWQDRRSLLDPGYHGVENGWRRMDDGSGYVAVRTFFPGATPEMLDWWFEWAQKDEDIRYKIWYPGAHYAMSRALTPGAPDYENPKQYWGKSRFPVEDVGMGVAQLRLDFVPPYEFGFENIPANTTMLTVRVGAANGLLKTTDMIHYVRPVEGGVEMRSRFWMARDLEAMSGGAGLLGLVANNRFFKQRLLPDKGPRELAFHCVTEYSQLASFLPPLYRQYGPRSSGAI